jgi:cytochrome P450
VNVQWAAGVTHFNGPAWGEDPRTFKPDRWIDQTMQEEKSRRTAWIPFGGGKNLCPGRNFAQTEILGLVATVALAFVVYGVSVPPDEDPILGASTRRPTWGDISPAIKIQRREGWENTKLAYVF